MTATALVFRPTTAPPPTSASANPYAELVSKLPIGSGMEAATPYTADDAPELLELRRLLNSAGREAGDRTIRVKFTATTDKNGKRTGTLVYFWAVPKINRRSSTATTPTVDTSTTDGQDEATSAPESAPAAPAAS